MTNPIGEGAREIAGKLTLGQATVLRGAVPPCCDCSWKTAREMSTNWSAGTVAGIVAALAIRGLLEACGRSHSPAKYRLTPLGLAYRSLPSTQVTKDGEPK